MQKTQPNCAELPAQAAKVSAFEADKLNQMLEK
jgi:hypothetical protein